jgi:hypothetical protein
MEAVVTLAVWAACGYVCMQIAEKKGRDRNLWLIVGLLFGIFSVIIIALLPHV